ncbi:MAG TPA: tetratricopeptide repeat protein [Terriglobales bacterium]|nr:tetratricopeptide repeat protein [Terriglobales bacterium]
MRTCTKAGVIIAIVLSASLLARQLQGAMQQNDPSLSIIPGDIPNLDLDASQRFDLDRAMARHDYKRAERLLLDEADRNPNSLRSAHLLEAAGGIFFLDHQFLKSAIAWKKAEAIAPIDERSSFTLAMAYIKLNRRDWGRQQLEKLSAAHPANPLYLYWLARMDYDAQNYSSAISRLQTATAIDPQMMRAFDLLGLCYDYVGQMNEALKNYGRAVELNRQQLKPSPWPNVDLAVSLIAANRLPEAEENLREALRHDPNLPQAHYQLGRVLELQGRDQDSLQSLQRASELDPAYAEPHYLLGRIYQKLGQPEKAKSEIQKFRNLTKNTERHATASSAPSSD